MNRHRSISQFPVERTSDETADMAGRLITGGGQRAPAADSASRWCEGEAFATIYRTYEASVRAVCGAQLRDHPDAVDDSVQETFSRLIEHASDVRAPQSVGPWLRRTAKRLCIDYRRLARHRTESEWDGSAEGRAMPGVSLEEGVVQRHSVAAVLGSLRPVQAELLREHYVEQRPAAEIAQRHASTAGSIKVRLLLARRDGAKFATQAGWQGLLPWPLGRWFRRLFPQARNIEAGVAAAVAPLAIVGLLLSPSGPATPSGLDPPDRGGINSAVETTTSDSSVASVTPPTAPRSEEQPVAVGVPPSLAPSNPTPTDFGTATPERSAAVPIDAVDVPLTDRQMSAAPPESAQQTQEVGVTTPVTGPVAGVETYDDEEDAPAVDAAACDVAGASPVLLYCTAS